MHEYQAATFTESSRVTKSTVKKLYQMERKAKQHSLSQNYQYDKHFSETLLLTPSDLVNL